MIYLVCINFDSPFQFEFNNPEEWPSALPVINCITPIYHPNIDCSFFELEDHDSDCSNVCVSGLESDQWTDSGNLDDCIQCLLFLFYEPNIDDPLARGFGDNLNMSKFVDNVMTSLQGGTIYLDTGEGDRDTIVMEPNYGWLENHPQDVELAKEQEGKNETCSTEIKEERANDAVQAMDIDLQIENKTESACVQQTITETDKQMSAFESDATNDSSPLPKSDTVISAFESDCDVTDNPLPVLQRQTSKKDSVNTQSDVLIEDSDSGVELSPIMSSHHMGSLMVPRVRTEQYVSMCNTLHMCCDTFMDGLQTIQSTEVS